MIKGNTLLSLLEPKGRFRNLKTALLFWDGYKPYWRLTTKSISYRQLRKLVYSFSYALHALGIVPGERVVLMLPNMPQFVIAYFGALAAGCRVVPINPGFKQPEVLKVLIDSGARTIVALDRFYPLISKIKEESKLKHIILTTPQEALPFLKAVAYPHIAKKKGKWVDFPRGDACVKSFAKLLQKASKSSFSAFVRSGDIAVLLYTSGTTGEPRGVVHTHKALLCNALMCRQLLPQIGMSKNFEKEQEVFLAALPYFHILGLSTMLHAPLLIGAKITMIPDPRTTGALLAAIRHTKATAFVGIPGLYDALTKILSKSKGTYYISSLKICISGSSKLSEDTKEKFESIWGKRILVGFGMSESGVTHCQRSEDEKEDSVGYPLTGVRQKILNPSEDGIGELLIKGKSIMLGYWGLAKKAGIVDGNGWLHTGDLARIDENGCVFLAGRIKEMIKGSNGENVYPAEVEGVLMNHSFIKEAAVIGVPHPKYGQTIKAYVVLKSNGKSSQPASFLAPD